MIQLVALVGAIALITVVQMLRAILAYPFARTRVRPVAGRPPASLEPLFEAATRDLAELGFGPPQWVLATRTDGEPESLPLRAAFVHPEGTRAWLAPPVDPRRPHRPFVYYASRLADGRLAISQPFDCYYEGTQTAEVVARTAAESGFAAQFAAHQRWVAGLGSAVTPTAEAAHEALEAHIERHRQALLEAGALRAITPDLAVPRAAFAWRLLRMVWRLPKGPAEARPVPADRLAWFARRRDIVRHRAPPRDVQWALFGLSVVLFMALGALIWDVSAALAILVVVLIHELGHFVAMRAFGYRNVHILALPLVGGVAMGIDAQPSATRRAWMSLMGPLPGIVIGWALLLAALPGLADLWTSGWVLELAIVFLILNYLNILPIPPLDGAHVVQALLPPRFARLQTAFVAIASVGGAWAAWHFGFYLLAALALMQLLALGTQWRVHGAEREMAAAPSAGMQRSTRILQVLRVLERHLGPASNAQQRLNQAEHVLTRLQTKPMGHVARALTALVYALLLAGPVGALALYGSMLGGFGDGATARFEALEGERDAKRATARKLPLPELLQPSPGEPGAAPASEVDLAAAQDRLGRALPTELRDLYTVANGAPHLGLSPIESIVSAGEMVDREIAPYANALSMEVAVGDDWKWIEVPLSEAGRWWWIGGDVESPLLYLPDPDPRLPDTRVVSFSFEGSNTYASLRDYLVDTRVTLEEMALWEARRVRREREMQSEIAALPTVELLALWEPPGLLARLTLDKARWPQGAGESRLEAAGKRLGAPIPADLRELLLLHDGFPPLQLLPSDRIAPWRDFAAGVPDSFREFAFGPRAPQHETPGTSADPAGTITEEQVADCMVVSAQEIPSEGKATVWPRLLWCPHDRRASWLDLQRALRYQGFRQWLIAETAPVAASRDLADAGD